MLRRFADSIFQQLLVSFPAGPAYPRSALDREEMPPAVHHYLVQSLQTRLEVEVGRVRQLGSPWFDIEHPEVRNALNALSTALSQRGQFPSEEWSGTLERAVRNVVSYHARPARTLVDFLYPREEDVYTFGGIQRKLGFFFPYPYLADVLEAYVAQKRPDDIGRDAFATLLRRIDEQMLADQDVDGWMKLLNPLFEIADVLSEQTGRVPVDLVLSFFRDKAATVFEHAVERAYEESGIDTLDQRELRDIMRRVRERPTQTDAMPPRKREAGASAPASQVRQAPEAAGPVPLWQQFQHGVVHPQRRAAAQPPPRREASPLNPPAPVEPVERTENVETNLAPSSGTDTRPLWMRFSPGHGVQSTRQGEVPPTSAPRGLSDLELTVLGERAARNRTDFVSVLFGGSQTDYHAVLERLSGARSWPEASRVIADDVFRRHQVNIYSEPAVSFTNAVEARFETR